MTYPSFDTQGERWAAAQPTNTRYPEPPAEQTLEYPTQVYPSQGYQTQPYPTQQPYGAPQYPYAQVAPANPYLSPQDVLPEHPSSVTVLVLGVLGFFFWITAPIAWVMGSSARREMRSNPGRYRPSPMLTAGYMLGIVMTSLGLAFFLMILLFIVIAMVTFA
ncbi:MAG: hypothetical protein WAV45_15065 [Propionibacteriaceae bacterium]|nr:hypothetical protein [Micropruina sp.]HBX81768.1 hypothetical protein [Propionibacteriaceae bacterium]HBY24261.1 hypothetical protein [Propionibacteriaceae bacterium]